MTERRKVLERIAAALERMAPPVIPQTDWMSAPAFTWDGESGVRIDHLEALALETLRGVDDQKAAVTSNIERLAMGAAAHDMLLWGARGMGKSALIRSAVAATQSKSPGAVRLIQVASAAAASIPALLRQLADTSGAYVLLFDDLGFGPDQSAQVLALRSLLDGGLTARPARVRIAVTSNRRAIVNRDTGEAEALHERDARDDALALADRFGLTLGFHPCDTETYLEILRAYTEPLGLDVDEEEALAWAISRGNRSGRTALQYATELAGRVGVAI